MAFLGSLLPGIIHNLSTPLSGVLGATQLLEMRTSSTEELVNHSADLDNALREELNKNFERNRINIDIITRNAKYLSDIIHILVQRINRGTSDRKDSFPLNDLVRNEIRFLEADLVFKHKVKKNISLGPDAAVKQYVYGHVATMIDEFITYAIESNDFSVALMEMDFETCLDGTHMVVKITARITPSPTGEGHASSLDTYAERLRANGWLAEIKVAPTVMTLELACPRQVQTT
jgi:hypothetical protein